MNWVPMCPSPTNTTSSSGAGGGTTSSSGSSAAGGGAVYIVQKCDLSQTYYNSANINGLMLSPGSIVRLEDANGTGYCGVIMSVTTSPATYNIITTEANCGTCEALI